MAMHGMRVGCGGGGAAELYVSPQNAEEVVAQGVGTVEFLQGVSEMVEGYTSAIEDQGAQVVPCESGNVIVNVDDVGEQGVVSTGDSVEIVFQACDVGLGVVFNGRIAFVASDVTGAAPGAFSRQLDVTINGLSISAGGALVSVDGAFSLEQSGDGEGTIKSVVSGARLSAYAQGQGGISFSGSVSDFRLEHVLDMDSGDYATEMTASVTGKRLPGTVTYATTVPFTGSGDGPPEAGTFLVTGAGGSTATVVAMGGGAVQILIDVDGDESPEFTINTTWDALLNDDA
jgi:hypothetical protein